jgi:rhodanese-related sulfurtransferase
MHNNYLDLHIVDVRPERDWNLFHLWGAEHIEPSELSVHRETFADLPDNGVIVLVSNDEAQATQAWKLLMSIAKQPNAYILAGGINRWLDTFSAEGPSQGAETQGAADDTLRHPIKWALGARHPAALPDPHDIEHQEFTNKVKLQKRIVKKGGCG